MFGSIVRTAGYVDTAYGIFHEWKMSGPHYNNYADPRVGSPITTQYHWWNTAEVSWYGPILRTGCSSADTVYSGPFTSMHSLTSVNSASIGSGSLVLRTNYIFGLSFTDEKH